ncbi:AAA family ATPase [Cryptosporangium phraense]|uniref:AAA family ATPase n=1 Tax=Cryptosporangium phraense TaxID=2593070 RepID=A0A545B2Q1_9ACTN|nr:AAA family ATPase [Cryptosporangium phraense]
MRIWRDGVELNVGHGKQANLLALLLARANQPVGTGELIAMLWSADPPATAVNVVQKYVGALRRLLEPGIAARDTGSYLVRRGAGYMFSAGPDVLDVVRFRESIEAARADPEPRAALDAYAEALGLWRGPVADGFVRETGAMPVFAAVEDEFLDACAAAAELAVALGAPDRVAQPLQLAASMAPLHEPVLAALVTTLGAAGRQADALAVYQQVRTRLAEELGVDPGRALQDAQQFVLTRSLPSQPPTRATTPSPGLVGRAEELAVLRQGLESARTGGASLVLLEGEPGVGKTRLVEAAAGEAAQRGALVVWGSCLEGDGTPAMWPWVRTIGAVLDHLPTAEREKWLAGSLGRLVETRDGTPALPRSDDQFRLFEQAATALAAAGARQPVMVVIDDLQWADVASLHLFVHLTARLPAGVLLVGTLRNWAPLPDRELTRVLAEASRVPGHRRIRLGPLSPDEVAELVRRETGQLPDVGAVRRIRLRTAGNPFFVRELARLLADEGELTEDAVAEAGVPSTVRDIVRGRLAGLDEPARDLLQIAALVGRDVDLRLLARAADLTAQACLDRLEPVEALGLLGPDPGNPFSYRFAHDLVRESVSVAASRRQEPGLHLRIANALEDGAQDGESVAERLAHHLWSAGPLADPARTAAALVRAGRRATMKYAFEAAERQLLSAVDVARGAGLPELELAALSQLTTFLGMRVGSPAADLRLLQRAETLARTLGRELDAVEFLYSQWIRFSQGVDIGRSGRQAQQMLDQGLSSRSPIVGAYGACAWGVHQYEIGHSGEAVRSLTRAYRLVTEEDVEPDEVLLQRRLQREVPVWLATMTALHGDVDAARRLFATAEADAGDDRSATTIWAGMAALTAATVGDPAWALRAAERGIATDLEFSWILLGTYQRLARSWAGAVTGDDPGRAAAEARDLIEERLVDPPLASAATWYGLLAEAWLAAGEPDEAAAALDRADAIADATGQRDAAGLIALMHARVLAARGRPADEVRAAAEDARALSLAAEAHLFVRRADDFLAELALKKPRSH